MLLQQPSAAEYKRLLEWLGFTPTYVFEVRKLSRTRRLVNSVGKLIFFSMKGLPWRLRPLGKRLAMRALLRAANHG